MTRLLYVEDNDDHVYMLKMRGRRLQPGPAREYRLGHGALDGGAGHTYWNEQTGYEFSAVAGSTYNFINPSTQYLNGVDFHRIGARRASDQQLQIGLVGYLIPGSCYGGSETGEALPDAGRERRRAARLYIPLVELDGNVTSGPTASSRPQSVRKAGTSGSLMRCRRPFPRRREQRRRRGGRTRNNNYKSETSLVRSSSRPAI